MRLGTPLLGSTKLAPRARAPGTCAATSPAGARMGVYQMGYKNLVGGSPCVYRCMFRAIRRRWIRLRSNCASYVSCLIFKLICILLFRLVATQRNMAGALRCGINNNNKTLFWRWYPSLIRLDWTCMLQCCSDRFGWTHARPLLFYELGGGVFLSVIGCFCFGLVQVWRSPVFAGKSCSWLFIHGKWGGSNIDDEC